MTFHRNFFGMPKKSHWNYTEISLELHWNFCAISVKLFSRISVKFHWYFIEISLEWNISGISQKFPRIIPLKFQRNFSVIPMKIFRRVTTSNICCKKISLNSDFIHIFSCFSTCIYSPGAGADNNLWTKFWCQQNGLVTLPICCLFKKKYLWSLILYRFLPIYIHVYSPGAGAWMPWGQNFDFNINLLSLCSFAVSFFH